MKFPKYKLEFNKKVIFIYKSYAQSKLHPKSDFSPTRARIEAGESEHCQLDRGLGGGLGYLFKKAFSRAENHPS